MAEQQERAKPGPAKISLDTWAVIFALLLAVLVRLGALKHIPW